jgi:hypothetical protein
MAAFRFHGDSGPAQLKTLRGQGSELALLLYLSIRAPFLWPCGQIVRPVVADKPAITSFTNALGTQLHCAHRQSHPAASSGYLSS